MRREVGFMRGWVRALLTVVLAAGVATMVMSGSSVYFSGPDGERLELIKDSLGEMYGATDI